MLAIYNAQGNLIQIVKTVVPEAIGGVFIGLLKRT